MRLEGKVATITGSGRGMGEAIARSFARNGASVIISDIDVEAAKTVASSIVQDGGRAEAIQIDVTKESDAQALADFAVEMFGRLDIHVNNAGVSVTKTFLNLTREDMEVNLQVNLVGAFLCGQAAARQMMKQRSGRIINITSLSGQRGGVARAAYGSSKAGLELLTKVMSVELAAHGINTNAIAPGAIETEMSGKHHDEATREAYLYLIPQRRYGIPQEIADASVFLASDEARHICGQVLNVDGGFLTAGLMYDADGVEISELPKISE